VFYVETITNPLVQVVALDEVARFARERGLVSVIDNTLATPINFRPVEHGFDLVVHSATKYLNGHNDIVAGVVAGRAELVGAVKHKVDHLGGALDPHACFLLHRGLKTPRCACAIRTRRAEIASYLARHPAVAAVHYPGLERHPHHARARQWFAGAGGLLAFELTGGIAAVERMFGRLTLPMSAPSLGGPETLITRPATTSHAGLSPDDRKRQGTTDGLVRLSVGLGSTQDLIDAPAAALAEPAERSVLDRRPRCPLPAARVGWGSHCLSPGACPLPRCAEGRQDSWGWLCRGTWRSAGARCVRFGTAGWDLGRPLAGL
jgi:cystathionine beta-lyase/cystathionine gamma-synthase